MQAGALRALACVCLEGVYQAAAQIGASVGLPSPDSLATPDRHPFRSLADDAIGGELEECRVGGVLEAQREVDVGSAHIAASVD